MSERTRVVLACAAGAGLALFAAGRNWLAVTQVRPAPLPPLHEVKTGTDLVPWLSALGLVALAGAGALLATRGWPRSAVGVLLLLSGGGLAVGAGTHLAVGWPLATVAGGVLVAGAGAWTLIHGRTWPSMAARYDRPAPANGLPTTDAQIWDALDRGDDPTR